MFYKNLNLYGLLSFEANDYNKVIALIKNSRGYLSYIDSEKNVGKRNPRYESYINLKQAAYTRAIMNNPSDNDEVVKFYTLLSSNTQLSNDKLDDFIAKHGLIEDYEYEYNMEYEGEVDYVATHIVKPIEYSSFYTALEIDDQFERINRSHLDADFVLGNFQRFTLLPFVGKYNNELVKPLIIATVYDVGMITIQVSIGHSIKRPIIPDKEPNQFELSNVQLYKKHDKYTSKDFWEKDSVNTATIYDILDYYFEQLNVICTGIELLKESDNQLAWVFGDFENDKRPVHSKFVEENKSVYVAHLANTYKNYIDKMSVKNMNDILDEGAIVQFKSFHFYCINSISLLSFSHSAFKKEILSYSEKQLSEIKDKDIRNEVLEYLYIDHVEHYMFDYLRFYELTFIKKYYALRLLKNLTSNSFQSLKSYVSVREEFNFLKLNYDEENLFKSVGSPRATYTKLLEKSGTNNILDKVEDLFNNAFEDVKNKRNLVTTQLETYILIITSVLTVIFGYNGIKVLVYDILTNLPYLGSVFSSHPLRWTVLLWIILLLGVGLLNVKRYKASKLLHLNSLIILSRYYAESLKVYLDSLHLVHVLL